MENPYQLDNTFSPTGYVGYIEGTKGEQGREWRGTAKEDYDAFDPETKVRSMAFIRKNAEAGKPFYLAWWPMMTSFIPSPEKKTVSRGLYTDNMQYNVDAFIGELMDELERLGIAENTLLVAMADNGPMAHNPPPGLGMVETIFRGGKGDFLEGGCACAGICVVAWRDRARPAGRRHDSRGRPVHHLCAARRSHG